MDLASPLPSRRAVLLGTGALAATAGATLVVEETHAAGPYDLGSMQQRLRSGDRGAAVRNLQRALNDHLRRGLVIDGHVGVGTLAAARSFQARERLVVDGVVGPAVKQALNRAPAPPSSPAPAAPGRGPGGFSLPDDDHATAARGAGAPLRYTGAGNALVNGTRVRFAAETFVRLGIIRAVPRTEKLTMRTLVGPTRTFQRRYRLTSDGIIGRGTWATLNAARGTTYPFTMDSSIAPTERRARNGTATARIDAMDDDVSRFVDRSPYTWGGAGYGTERWAGFDCSGLVFQMVAAGGILLTSTTPIDHARESFRSTRAIYTDTTLRTVPLREMRDGDIVTFAKRSSRRVADICHDGIYLDGHLVEASSRGVVRTRWTGGDIRREGYVRSVMPQLKRPFV